VEGECARFESLCKSLTGIDVPMLTVTSFDSNECEVDNSLIKEIAEREGIDSIELYQEINNTFTNKTKEVLIITARIHPGEAIGSFMMEGFIKFITSLDPIAIELRNKFIIKIIPMMNIDGVILGNSRCCISGEDLNRRFANPNTKLHPTICSIKELINNMQIQGKKVVAYIDMHGHSRKKCTFIYGPYYPLHSSRYLRVRMLAKLISERTLMFRYPACKFRQENSKRNTARLVISREFNVMNSFTLESSFYGFLDAERKTIEFSSQFYERMGEHLAGALREYTRLVEGECIMKCVRAIENKKKYKLIHKNKPKLKNKEQEAGKKTVKKIEEIGRHPLRIGKTVDEAVNELERKCLEDYYLNPKAFDIPLLKRYCIEDLCESIKKEIGNEDQGDSSNSSISSEENESYEEEKVNNAAKNSEQEACNSKLKVKDEDQLRHLRGRSERLAKIKQLEFNKNEVKDKQLLFPSRRIYINEKVKEFNHSPKIFKNAM